MTKVAQFHCNAFYLDQTDHVFHQPHDNKGGEDRDEEHEGGRQDEEEDLEDKIIQDGCNFKLKEPPLFPRHLQQGEGGFLFLIRDSVNCVYIITTVTYFLHLR